MESNLQPKVSYLRDALGLSSKNLTKVIVNDPRLLGRSLNQTIIPAVEGLRGTCGLSYGEIGSMFVQVPQLILLNQKTNLDPKVEFLRKRLELSQSSLRNLLITMPRILVHSVATSLEPKLQMLEEAANAANETETVKKIVIGNPSLLLSNKKLLERRIGSFRMSNNTFVETFQPRRSQLDEKKKIHFPRIRRKRPVLELSNKVVLQTLVDVDTAASTIGTSRANMYDIIKTGRLFKGKSYVYGSLEKNVSSGSEAALESPKNDDRKATFLRSFKMNYTPQESGVCLVDVLRHSSVLSQAGIKFKSESNTIHLVAFVSGRTYPPERYREVKGRRKAGGMSMFFPQLRGSHTGEKLLRAAAERCFANQIMPHSENYNGTRYCDGVVLVGYPYTRPSRNRCGLYVCRDVLRVIFELLSLESSCPKLQKSTVEIDIFTESSYAWNILQNSTSLLRWGSSVRKDDFVYDGDAPKWKVNPDILYPLSRTYFRVVKQDLVPRDGRIPASLAQALHIRYRHQSEVEWTWDDSTWKTIGGLAETAASWQYERSQKLLL